MQKQKPKAIALLRVSTETQAEKGGGLAGQRRAAKRIAEQHGLEIVDELELRGVSGTKVQDDPDFRRLLDRIQDPAIHGVVVADMDRLLRPEDPGAYSIFRRFKESATVIYTSSGARDYRHDRLLMMIESEIAALERERIAERTQRGKEEKRRKGLRAEGGVGMPRGVAFDHDTARWSYVWPDAEKVRKVFRAFIASGGRKSLRQIAFETRLVEGTYQEPSGAVSRLLRQPLYMGVYRVDRKWKEQRFLRMRDPHESYEVAAPGLDPPLVSREDFERVQVLLKQNLSGRAPKKPHDQQGATYAGHLECAACGGNVWVQPDFNGYRGYFCGNTRTKGCATGQTSARLAEPQIDAALEEKLGSVEVLRSILERSAEEARDAARPKPKEATRRLTELANMKERAKDAYEAGAYELPELQKRLAKIDGEATLLEELISREDDGIALDARLVQELVDVFCNWSTLRRAEKRKLLAAYEVRIAISRPRRRVLKVERVVVGVTASQGSERIYKKMKGYKMG